MSFTLKFLTLYNPEEKKEQEVDRDFSGVCTWGWYNENIPDEVFLLRRKKCVVKEQQVEEANEQNNIQRFERYQGCVCELIPQAYISVSVAVE